MHNRGHCKFLQRHLVHPVIIVLNFYYVQMTNDQAWSDGVEKLRVKDCQRLSAYMVKRPMAANRIITFDSPIQELVTVLRNTAISEAPQTQNLHITKWALNHILTRVKKFILNISPFQITLTFVICYDWADLNKLTIPTALTRSLFAVQRSSHSGNPHELNSASTSPTRSVKSAFRISGISR